VPTERIPFFVYFFIFLYSLPFADPPPSGSQRSEAWCAFSTPFLTTVPFFSFCPSFFHFWNTPSFFFVPPCDTSFFSFPLVISPRPRLPGEVPLPFIDSSLMLDLFCFFRAYLFDLGGTSFPEPSISPRVHFPEFFWKPVCV